MTLSQERTRAYSFGALTGAFAAVALVALRRRRVGAALVALVASACCGALAVGFEEAASEAHAPDRLAEVDVPGHPEGE